MKGTPATNPNVKRTFCGIRRRQQKAYESMQRIMANVNGSQQQNQEGGGESAASRRANQSETKLITLRGNVITKIFSPSSAARRATKCHLSSLVCATRTRERDGDREKEVERITQRLPWVRPGLMCGPKCARRVNATNNMLHVI